MRLSLHSQFTVGAIAQLVEQRTENPCVPGSIPGGTTKIRQLYFYNCLIFMAINFQGDLHEL